MVFVAQGGGAGGPESRVGERCPARAALRAPVGRAGGKFVANCSAFHLTCSTSRLGDSKAIVCLIDSTNPRKFCSTRLRDSTGVHTTSSVRHARRHDLSSGKREAVGQHIRRVIEHAYGGKLEHRDSSQAVCERRLGRQRRESLRPAWKREVEAKSTARAIRLVGGRVGFGDGDRGMPRGPRLLRRCSVDWRRNIDMMRGGGVAGSVCSCRAGGVSTGDAVSVVLHQHQMSRSARRLLPGRAELPPLQAPLGRVELGIGSLDGQGLAALPQIPRSVRMDPLERPRNASMSVRPTLHSSAQLGIASLSTSATTLT